MSEESTKPGWSVEGGPGGTYFINLIPLAGGGVTTVKPQVNGVLVQLVPGVGYEGEPIVRRAISIMCIDSDMLPALKEEARRILGAL